MRIVTYLAQFLLNLGFPGGSDGKETACNAGDLDLIHGLGRCPEGGMAILLPGEFHGKRSLEGYSPWGNNDLDTTK